MTQNRKYAVTGGIGSGKSAACDILSKLGYPVFSCDDISRQLWQQSAYREALAALFPTCSNGNKIDKAALTALVFSNEDARRRLEAFSHPRIMQALAERMAKENISFAEVPLLFEGGYEDLFDGVILIRRDKKTRIAAVQERDGLTEKEVRARISAQISVQPDRGVRIFCIENSSSLTELEANLCKALDFFGIN